MKVNSISLRNFRNYKEQVFKPHQTINVITGSNAQGKTNLIEAIYYSLRGRSFRALKEREVIKWQSEQTNLNTEIDYLSRKISVEWKIKEGSKKLLINGVDTLRSDLDSFGIVLFCPEDLYLIKGSPQERRHFLDYDIGPLNTEYSQTFRQYAKILNHRNALLKDIRDRRSNLEMLSIWNEQLYRYGAKVIFLRLQILKKLIPIARKIHYELTEGKEELQAKYLSSLVLEPGLTENQIFNIFELSSKKLINTEIKRTQTLLGPHRDDLYLAINGIEAKSFGSQGQQRTITLSLKLSQIELWYREFGDYPLLLLDDVLFELDKNRQLKLMNSVFTKVQTFITTSFTGGIEEYIRGDGLLWYVENGKLSIKEEL